MTSKTNLASTPRVIAITSGKGGVGKTNICLNLGLALAQLENKILLLDADLGLANLNILLGLEPTATIEKFLSGDVQIGDVIIRYTPNNSTSEIDIIPASSGVRDLTNLNLEQCLGLSHAIENFGQGYDFLIIDTGAGIGNNVTFFNAAADEIIVIVNHEPTSIADAYALIKVLSQEYHQKDFCIIVNKNPMGRDARQTFSKLANASTKFLHVSLKYLGALPDDNWVEEAVIKQQAYTILAPSSKITQETNRIAGKIATNYKKTPLKGGIQFFFESIANIDHICTKNTI